MSIAQFIRSYKPGYRCEINTINITEPLRNKAFSVSCNRYIIEPDTLQQLSFLRRTKTHFSRFPKHWIRRKFLHMMTALLLLSKLLHDPIV